MKTQLRMIPLDGAEHLAYLEAVLREPSLNPQDIVKLRDRPDVLHHIKGVYSVLLHNIACLIEKNANKHLPPEKFIPFPKGRIKLLNSEDYTFSFTELSEYGRNADTFSQLYTSLGVTQYPLTLDGLNKAIEFIPRDLSYSEYRKTIEELLFPKVHFFYVNTISFLGRLGYDPIQPIFPFPINQDFLERNINGILKGSLDIELTPSEAPNKVSIPNYSYPYNYQAWDNEEVYLTNEALEAFYTKKLISITEPKTIEVTFKEASDIKIPRKTTELNQTFSIPGSIIQAEEGLPPRKRKLNCLTFENTYKCKIAIKKSHLYYRRLTYGKSVKIMQTYQLERYSLDTPFSSKQLTEPGGGIYISTPDPVSR